MTSGRPALEDLKKAVKEDLTDVDVQYRKPTAVYGPTRRSVALATIALVLVAFVFGLLVNYFSPDPRVSVTPDHGSAGSKITIRGEKYDQYDFVTISFSESYGAPSKGVRTVQADGDGHFETEVTVPAGLPKGQVQIALGARSSNYVYKDFYVTD